MRKYLVAALTLSLFNGLNAQQEDSLFIRKISNEMLVNGKAYEQLRELTKGIGHRLAGSPGMVMAENWGKKQMQASGAEKVWMQECMVPRWVRGGKDELNFAPASSSGLRQHKFDVIALGNSVGTGKKGLVAQVVEVTSFADLEAKKDLVQGKIVFYNYKFRDDYVRTFESYVDAVKYRGGGPSAASKYGAQATIVRSMSSATDNYPHTGGLGYDSAYAKIPAVAIGLKDADWLSEALTKQPVITLNLKTNGHFLPDTIGHNVIGEITGSEFPDQIITIGGHLDSWDLGEGAHDDGTGCVQTMEILRSFKAIGFKPKHTIRFVLFANEENGARGGKQYAEEARKNGEKHVFALESDGGGFTPRGFGFTVPEASWAKLNTWKSLLEPYGGGSFSKGGGGTDIAPLNKLMNVPLAGLEPDTQRYFDIHHTRNDVFENVNKRELLLGAVNMAALVYLVDKYGL